MKYNNDEVVDAFLGVIIGFTITALFIGFVIGLRVEHTYMKKEAVKTHNAHYVVDEHGSPTFQWNNK